MTDGSATSDTGATTDTAASTGAPVPAEPPGLARSSAVMAAGTAVSRLLGFARAMVLIAAIGVTGASADAFDLANKTPSILYLLLAGGVLNAVLVPAIVRAARRDGGGDDFVDRLLTLCFGLLLVATLVLTLAAPLLVRLYASSGYSADRLALATAFAYWCLPQLLFYGLYAVLGQVLNARGHFGGYMWAPVLNNVVAIAGLVVFVVAFDVDAETLPGDWSAAQVAVLGGGATLGVVAQGLVLWWPLRASGYRYRPRFGVRGVGLGSARRVAMWTFAAVVVAQVGVLVSTRVSSGAGAAVEGTAAVAGTAGNSAYSTAYLLFMLPHSLVAVSLVTALFTRMARSAHDDDWPAIRRDLTTGLRTVGVLVVPAAAALVALGLPVGVAMTGSLAGGGAVGHVAAAMALGLPAFSAAYLLQRVFYAYEDARSPFLVALPATAVVVASGLLAAAVLPPDRVVVGIGVGMSASAVVSAALAATLLRRRHGRIGGHEVVRTYVRLLVAAVPAGLLAWGVSRLLGGLLEDGVLGDGRLGGLVVVAAGGAVLLVVYVAGLRLLHVAELAEAVALLRRRLRR